MLESFQLSVSLSMDPTAWSVPIQPQMKPLLRDVRFKSFFFSLSLSNALCLKASEII